MTVRFLPIRGEEHNASHPEHPEPGGNQNVQHAENLAEVVAFRLRDAKNDQQPAAQPELPVFDRAVRLLARRAFSQQELAHALLKEGYSEADVDEALEECLTRHYLDDAALAQRIVEKAETRKRLSRTMLQRLLRDRLIPQQIIEHALLELSGETEDVKMLAVARERASKLGGLERSTAERRLAGYLARRGFSGGGVYRAVRQALDETQ